MRIPQAPDTRDEEGVDGGAGLGLAQVKQQLIDLIR